MHGTHFVLYIVFTAFCLFCIRLYMSDVSRRKKRINIYTSSYVIIILLDGLNRHVHVISVMPHPQRWASLWAGSFIRRKFSPYQLSVKLCLLNKPFDEYIDCLFDYLASNNNNTRGALWLPEKRSDDHIIGSVAIGTICFSTGDPWIV